MPHKVIDDPLEIAISAAYSICPTDKNGMERIDRVDCAAMVAAGIRAYLELLTRELP